MGIFLKLNKSCLCALAIFCAQAIASEYSFVGKVTRVIDGDTIHLVTHHKKAKIRLYGIDAPEKGQPFGKQSKKMLATLILNKVVSAKCLYKDIYKRDVCTLFLKNLDINAAMVAKGGAWVFKKYYKGSDYFKDERQARAKKRGLWGMNNKYLIPPWTWRKAHKNKY